KNISVEKGGKWLFDQYVYFFYITNDWYPEPQEIVLAANDRCNQELAGPAKGGRTGVTGTGGQSDQQLGVHGDDGVGLEPESVVGFDTAGRGRSLAGTTPGRQTVGLEDRVQDVRECVCPFAVSNRADRGQVGVPLAGLEPVPA